MYIKLSIVEKSYKFKKAERLCSTAQIEELFNEHEILFKFPFKLVWRKIENKRNHPVQVSISVGKKRFRHAVDRNYMKRHIREAYRLNKHIILDNCDDFSIDMMFIYVDTKLRSFVDIEPSMKEVLNKLAKKISNIES